MPGSNGPKPDQWPPPFEDTDPETAASRLLQEKEAKRIKYVESVFHAASSSHFVASDICSDEIDQLIEQERIEIKKRQPQAKLLLLGKFLALTDIHRTVVTPRPGQSEAGKSTLLKNFQLQFAPKAFQADTEAWRAVIHLNLVRAVNFILELLSTPPLSYTGNANGSISSLSNYHGRQPTTDPLRHLRMRLSPLRQVELLLQKRLCSDTPSEQGTFDYDMFRGASANSQDVAIRARSGWKALAKMQRPTSSTSQHDALHDARQIIEACREDVMALWANELVHVGLREREVVLEDHCILCVAFVSPLPGLDR